MPTSNYFHQAKLTPEQEERIFNTKHTDANHTDLNIHLKAREYRRGLYCADPGQPAGAGIAGVTGTVKSGAG